jgi:prophage regulatory protein
LITPIPENSYLRLAQITPNIVPVGRSTLWEWVKEGKFPKPVKLSPRVTVWRSADVREWMAQRNATASKVVH